MPKLWLSTLFLLSLAPVAGAAPAWHVLETPRFTVVSQLSEKETRAWASQFNQFIDSLKGVVRINERLLPRLTVVIFARERDFKPYLPQKPNGKPWDVAGYFSRWETWATIGLTDHLDDADTRQIIFHEGVHWVVSVYPRYLPLCMNEGLAEVFSTFEIKDGCPHWGEPIASHVDYLNQGRESWLAIDKLLLTTNSNPLFNEDERVGVFYAESWAFVHYLMFGKREGSRSALDDFLTAFSEGSNTEQSFRKAFGVEYAEMDKQLQRYLRSGQYFQGKGPLLEASKAVEPFTVAPADLVEVALARLALGSNHLALARRHADAAVKLAPDKPSGYDVLACIEAQEKGDDASTETPEKAIKLGSKDAWTFVLLAYAKARAAIALGGIPPSEAREIANLLERAVNLRPNLMTAYERLAFILSDVEKVSDQDGAFLQYGHNLFPDEGVLFFGQAQLARKRGDKNTALELLAKAIAHPGTMSQSEIDYARQTRTRWIIEEVWDNAVALANGGKFQEALDLIDKSMTPDLPPATRGSLLNLRDQFTAQAKLQAALQALSEKRNNDARGLLQEVIDMPRAPLNLRKQAENILGKVPAVQKKSDADPASDK